MEERLFLRLDGDPVYAPETSVPGGTLRELAVPQALHGHVGSLMAYDERIPDGKTVIERVLPDGLVRLIVDAQDGGQVRVAGPTASPAVLTFSGHLQGWSMALRPGAAAAVLGLPASELTDLSLPLAEVWPTGDDLEPLITRIAARLREHDDAPVRRQVHHAAQVIQRSGGSVRLRDVADSIGVGERRLQQLFRHHVGLSPRTYARLARLHACLRALRTQREPAWAEVAVDAGFYDQSHLVNEFKALCGVTPTEFLARTISVSSKTAAAEAPIVVA